MMNITIAGNIGRDAETRDVNGKSVTNFSVGVSAGRNSETTWFKCALWGDRGEKLAPYLTKGGKVTVAGRLTAGTYDGKPDLKIDVSEVALQGGKQDAPRDEQQRHDAPPARRYVAMEEDDLNDSVPF